MEREALTVALEALKEISRHATTPWEDEWCGELADETLTAINALAQPAQEPVCPECKAGVLYECVACSSNNYPPRRTEPPDWFPAVENILKEYGLQAIDFVADFKAAMKDAEQSERTEQEPVAWEDGPHLVMRVDVRDRLNYKGPWVDMGKAIPDKWIPVLYITPPAAQPAQWDAPSEAFNAWWDSDYDDSTNPYEKDTFAYWAWAGWQAALAQEKNNGT